jgi:uncharacterized membrane-anchored protein
MGILLGLLIIVLLVTGFSAFFISRKVYRLLNAKGNQAAMVISIISFVLSGAIILWVIAYIIFSNVEFGR